MTKHASEEYKKDAGHSEVRHEKAHEAHTESHAAGQPPAADADKTEEAEQFKALNEKYMRLVAEFDNYRKRSARDMADLRLNVRAETVLPMLEVMECFDKALAASELSDNIKSLREGLAMINSGFSKAMSELGVERLDAGGKPFDPAMHDAISMEESDIHDEGVVIKQWSYGYRLGGKLIKPAKVVVSSGKKKG